MTRGGPSVPDGDRARGGEVASPVTPALPVPLRTRLRGLTVHLSQWLRSTTYLRKWLVLGGLIGVIAGLGAVAFYNALRLATELFLRELAGYQIPTPAGEGNLAGSAGFPRAWLLPLIVGFGGLLSGIIVFTLAPEAEGHGTDAAIEAVHDNPRGVRARAVLVKIVASALTIGSGGSGGREGPTAQISAGFGSFLTRVLDLSPGDGRTAVATGIGSGIGSIFGAPLGGALLSAEILYREDLEIEALIPSFIASIIGYTVFSAFEGFAPLFGFAGGGYQFTDPVQLAWYAIIGMVGGFVGLAYSKGFYGMVDLSGRLPVPRAVRPALAGLLVGSLAVALPEVLGTGYGWIQKSLGHELLALPLWAVLAMPLGKIVATSLSIGSGGSGGIFGPGMVIGAFTGAAIWRLLEPIAPGVPHDPAPFVIVGMMACFGAISRAPLAVMIMVAEMTGTLAALAPALIAVGIATLIVRQADDTIYRSQLRRREDSPAHRFQASMPLLAGTLVSEVMQPPRVIFSARNGVGEAAGKLRREGLPGAPVADEAGMFIGVATLERLERAERANPDAEVGRVADPTVPSTLLSARLDSALQALIDGRLNWLPVLDDGRCVVGILSISALVRGYRAGLMANLRSISRVAHDAVVVDERVDARAKAATVPLRALGLPPGTIVMTIQRGTELLSPDGSSRLQPGDRVGVLTRTATVEEVRRLLLGTVASG